MDADIKAVEESVDAVWSLLAEMRAPEWEYMEEPFTSNVPPQQGRMAYIARLNELGEDGWELVSANHQSGLTWNVFLKRIKRRA